jgi:hypothetical protein
MTQIWPGFGEAPVPTLLSVICKPDAVVMGFPAVWADAIGEMTDVEAAAAIAANAVCKIVRREDRIVGTSLESWNSLEPVLIESEPALVFVWTRFLRANRYPPRSKTL